MLRLLLLRIHVFDKFPSAKTVRCPKLLNILRWLGANWINSSSSLLEALIAGLVPWGFGLPLDKYARRPNTPRPVVPSVANASWQSSSVSDSWVRRTFKHLEGFCRLEKAYHVRAKLATKDCVCIDHGGWYGVRIWRLNRILKIQGGSIKLRVWVIQAKLMLPYRTRFGKFYRSKASIAMWGAVPLTLRLTQP